MTTSDSRYPERVEVMGMPVDPFTMRQTVERAMDYIHEKKFAHFIGVNADKYLQMQDDELMREIVHRCEVVNADGASLVMAADVLGVGIPERVSGIDLMEELCSVAEKDDVGIFLLGAKAEVVRSTAMVLLDRYPALSIVGYRDGYFEEEECRAVAEEIRNSRASLVFVGITSPKKERVIEGFRKHGLDAVCVGVGGSFDVVSGLIKRAPVWMQRARLEWLFRMMQEPKRLMKRYLVGNTKFLFALLQAKRAAR